MQCYHPDKQIKVVVLFNPCLRYKNGRKDEQWCQTVSSYRWQLFLSINLFGSVVEIVCYTAVFSVVLFWILVKKRTLKVYLNQCSTIIFFVWCRPFRLALQLNGKLRVTDVLQVNIT